MDIQSLEGARSALADGDPAAALHRMELAFASGFPTPSEVLTDPVFRTLRDDPTWRPQLRDLMEGYAREHSMRMVDPEEPGTPLAMSMRFLDQESGEPLEGVHVKIVHVDHNGLYAPEDLDQKLISWNPRLFGFCTTDAEGTVHVQTIRPSYYHPHYDAEEPAHIHFTVNAKGYREWGGEIFFDDDPRVDDEIRRESRRVGTPIARTVPDEQGVLQTSVSLRLQRR